MVSTWSESHVKSCNYGILHQTVSHGGLHHVFGIPELQVGRFYQEIQRVGHVRSSAALPVDDDRDKHEVFGLLQIFRVDAAT